jgi:hypothetical protein
LQDFKAKELNAQELDMVGLIRDWWYDPTSFKSKSNRLYPTQSFKRPYILATTMFCRLYGEKDPQHFKLEWVPLMHQVTEKGKIFNWAQILSANIQQAVRKTVEAPSGFGVGFFMSAYLIDAICPKTPFPLMKWNWTPALDPIHIYCSILWNHK